MIIKSVSCVIRSAFNRIKRYNLSGTPLHAVAAYFQCTTCTLFRNFSVIILMRFTACDVKNKLNDPKKKLFYKNKNNTRARVRVFIVIACT